MGRVQVPDVRLLFFGSLLSQPDFVLVRRSPIICTSQLGDLAIRTIAPPVHLFPYLIGRVHSASGEQNRHSEKSISGLHRDVAIRRGKR